MRNINYYYKQSALEFKDELERQEFIQLNEYGYNFGTNQSIGSLDDMFLKPKNIVNKDFINLKR